VHCVHGFPASSTSKPSAAKSTHATLVATAILASMLLAVRDDRSKCQRRVHVR